MVRAARERGFEEVVGVPGFRARRHLVNVGVPETSEHGYQAQAATSTGVIDIQLQDGRTQQQGGAGGQQVTFLTDGFTSRDVQTTVNLATSTADITLHPS